MNRINDNKLREIDGGSKLVVGLLIASGITFLIGVIDGYIRPLKCNQEAYMVKLEKKDLVNVEGGLKLSASLFNSLAKGVNTLLNLGRSLGSSIRRIGSNNLCPI